MMITKHMKIIKPTNDKSYWELQDNPFRGFGLTFGEALFNLENHIKEHIMPKGGDIEKDNVSGIWSQDE